MINSVERACEATSAEGAARCASRGHQQMVQTHIEELQRNLETITQKIETYHQMEENDDNDSRYHTL